MGGCSAVRIVGGNKTFRELARDPRGIPPILARLVKLRKNGVTHFYLLPKRLVGDRVEYELALIGQSFDGEVGNVKVFGQHGIDCPPTKTIFVSADLKPTWEDPSE